MYKKLKKGDAGYELVKANKLRGNWACDAYNHNSNRGCPNPQCFKYLGKRK